MIGRLLELFEGPEAPGPWSAPVMPAALHALLPWRAWDESSELYVNAASTGFVLELPPFAGIDAETLGALAGTLADAAPERCTIQVLHWASPRFGASADAWGAPRAGAGGAMARMGQRRGALLAHGGWRKLHAGGPPFTLSDYRVFVTACLAGGPGPAAETALGAFRRALEGTLASAGAHARRLEPDALLSLAAELDALDEAEQAVRAIYHGQGWRVNAERYVQLPSWLACLPMASAGGLDADLERMGRMKTLLTASAVNLAPLHGEWRGQPMNPDNPPALFLIGRRGQPACWSPFANEAGNYNVAVTGKSGSGKSVLMQELVTGLIGAGGEAVVIDDGRSFQHTAEALEGAFIAFGKDAATLNPFAMIDAETANHDGDYREECFAMLAGVIGRMCRRRGGIDDIEAALIDGAIAAAWDQAGNAADLGTVRTHLEARDDRRAKDMATALGPWCPGGAMGRLFAGGNVPDLGSALTVFELAELKGRGDVQGVVLMLVVFLATQRMYHGPRTRAKAIVIDEAWDLLSGEDSKAFLEGAARRARKYRGALVTGTQSVNDYYANPAARAAWENSDWVIFLAQKDESVELLKAEKRIHCDPGMERALKSLTTADGRYAELVLHGPDGSGPGSRAQIPSAVSASSGSSRSRRTISTSSVAAPVPECSKSASRPAMASESARTVSTPTS